jgi:tripartite ATP-independent transporter DctP family solute receptor
MPTRMLARRRFLAVGAAATAAFASGLAARSAPSAAQQQSFKLAFPDNAAHPSMKVAQRFAAALAERTNGRFKVDIFPGGTLGSETNIVAGLQTGIVDFTMHTAGYVSSYVPTVGALDVPFLFKDKPAAQRVLAGEIGNRLAADALAKNIVILGWSQNGWRNVETVDKVVKAPDDLKGLKIRIQAGPIFAATFKAVGAVPVVIDAADLYVALQQKTIEGLEIPVPSTVSFKTYEVAKHIALTRHVYNATLFMGGRRKFEAMSPADQEVVQRTGAEAAAYWFELMGAADDEALKFCEQNGSQVTQVEYEAFRSAMAPVYDEARSRYGDLLQKLVEAAA